MSQGYNSSLSVALYKGRFIDWRTFEYHVAQTRINVLKNISGAGRKPPKVLNLCEDHYHFLVVFTASMLEGRTTVMPANRSKGELKRLTGIDEGIQAINDTDIVVICQVDSLDSSNGIAWDIKLVPNTMIVAELYTSGSTGIPNANPKTWRQLVIGAQQVCTRFSLDKFDSISVIATVPSQHMFGFEMSIILPLVCGVTIYHDQPFYPIDIQHALRVMPAPLILVTTPIHLSACVTIESGWPEIEFVVSATAPLSEDVAHQVENIMNTEAKEVYGCSEVGAIATRRMTKNAKWQLLSGYMLSMDNGTFQLKTPSIRQPVVLPDELEILPGHFFRLVGRTSDMVKIGGKRGSLSEITARLKSLPGVEDAVVFKPGKKESQRERLVALVVAPDQTAEQIRDALLYEVDPVFLPRPLCVVSALPYNSIGKLTKADLLHSLERYLKEKTRAN